MIALEIHYESRSVAHPTTTVATHCGLPSARRLHNQPRREVGVQVTQLLATLVYLRQAGYCQAADNNRYDTALDDIVALVRILRMLVLKWRCHSDDLAANQKPARCYMPRNN